MRIVRELCLKEETQVALKQLIGRCEVYDGCEPSLQMVHTLNCHVEMKSWILAYKKDELIGVLPIFQPMPHEAELAGCVHPDFRGRGVFKMLALEAMDELKKLGDPKILWMVNRKSLSGVAVLKHLDLALYQTEYTMKYVAREQVNQIESKVVWRRAVPDDIPEVAVIQASAFKDKREDALGITTRFFEDVTRENFIGYYENNPVASVSVFVADKTANINALAVLAEQQGKGIGKAFVSQLIAHYERLGFEMTLEVHSENQRAFQLYKDMGFQVIEAIDYYTRLKQKKTC